MSTTDRAFRPDIQALRGIAVLGVLFYHARLGFLSAGYLGVDIFFVISGFLITRMVAEGVDAGDFRFSAFYLRRARRLLPAAYVTFLLTAMAAPFLLTAPEMADFRGQLLGSLSFTANLVLRHQAGYFGGAAELKPLLHIWSLSLEEQYYFLLPGLLVFLPRRFWLSGVSIAFFASLFLCLNRLGRDSTFYLFETRAWELMLGSLGALAGQRGAVQRFLRAAFWPALFGMASLLVFKLGNYHPGPAAVLITCATLVVLLRAHPLLMRGPVIVLLAWVGDLSYSLYLVHWPLFAYLNNVWVGESSIEPSLDLRLAMLGLSFVLAYVLNRFVETPIRHLGNVSPVRFLVPVLAVSACLLLLPYSPPFTRPAKIDYSELRRVNYGLHERCEFPEKFSSIPECRTSERPRILVWGDSYAMHLVPALLAGQETPPALVQATRSGCGPFLDVAPGLNPNWARSCLSFNDSVLSYLKTAQSVDVVVLSSPFEHYTNPDEFLLTRDGRRLSAGVEEASASLRQTVRTIRALGKRVVVVAPPPSNGADVGRCLERIDNGLPVIGMSDRCQISVDTYHRYRGKVLDFLAALRQEVTVIDFDDDLCDASHCVTQRAGTLIYRDGGHLSHAGAALIGKETRLLEQVMKQAR